MKNLLEIIKKFSDAKILVVGDIMLDKYIFGEIKRINPEMPSAPLVDQKSIEYRLGGAANVAKNISSLDGKAYLCGVAGNDEEGKILKELCKKEIDGKIIVSDRPTTLKTRIVAGQQIVRIDREETSDITRKEENMLLLYINSYIDKIDAVIISDYAKGTITEKIAKEILRKSYENFVLVDTKPKKINYFRGCMLIAPNRKEAEEITGMKYEKSNIEKMARILKEKVNSRYVIITLGEDGMFIFDKDKIHIPAMAREVYDVTGAGDTVMASLALSLASGALLYEAALIANFAAGIVVGKIGTSSVSRKELEEVIKNVKTKEPF